MDFRMWGPILAILFHCPCSCAPILVILFQKIGGDMRGLSKPQNQELSLILWKISFHSTTKDEHLDIQNSQHELGFEYWRLVAFEHWRLVAFDFQWCIKFSTPCASSTILFRPFRMTVYKINGEQITNTYLYMLVVLVKKLHADFYLALITLINASNNLVVLCEVLTGTTFIGWCHA